MPVVGMVVLVPAAYLLNFFMDMRAATMVLLAAVVPAAVLRLLRGTPPAPRAGESALPLVAAVGLLAFAIGPHLVQGSLGLLAQSGDEETYYHLATYLLAYPAGSGMSGPPAPVFEMGLPHYRAEGWGFQYLLAAASAVSGVPTFNAYLPAAYLVLAASVPSWNLFFREVLVLPLGLESRPPCTLSTGCRSGSLPTDTPDRPPG